jgi:hypothetical protein
MHKYLASEETIHHRKKTNSSAPESLSLGLLRVFQIRKDDKLWRSAESLEVFLF